MTALKGVLHKEGGPGLGETPLLSKMAQLPAALLEEPLGVWGTAQGSLRSRYFCHLGDQCL